jgi:hypothetical protein
MHANMDKQCTHEAWLSRMTAMHAHLGTHPQKQMCFLQAC